MVSAKKKTADVYQLKVTLNGSSPPIWRRIHVYSDISLEALHLIIQRLMNWDGGHLHQFIINGEYYGIPEIIFGFEMHDEQKVKLNQVVSGEGDAFIYEYDFGDNWEHVIEVEKILQPEPGEHYPRCIAGKRACPPDDCGGIWGYYNLLEALEDPDHPEHEDMVFWIGENFDPEKFDLKWANQRLE